MARQTGRKVLTVDARNHGESTHSSEMSYEAMSADLQALLSQLGLPRCVLIGHSMGGKTAMTLALQKASGPGTYSGPTLFLGGSNSQFIR
uniref:sn-1-specific diacylglycerol lipase ABHD11 n=1 Tax=Ornithorhynchus anatinus TaxID=9258 RepID=A0A6I8NAW3_ORNAN